MPLRVAAWVVSLGKGGLVAGGTLLLVVSHWYAFSQGQSAEATAAEARMAEHLRRQIEQAEEIRRQDMAILTGVVERETRVVREVERVEVPVSDCSHLGSEWLRGYNAVIDAARGAEPSSGASGGAGDSRE